MHEGFDDPEIQDVLSICVQTIDEVDRRISTLPADPTDFPRSGSRLQGLLDDLSEIDPPVDVRCTIYAGADSIRIGLRHLRTHIYSREPVSLVSLAVACRTVLVAACRLLLVAGPTDAEVRFQNAKRVMLQESASLMRFYNRASTFKNLGETIVPPADIVAAQRQRHEALRKLAGRLSETEAVDQASAIIGQILTNESPEARMLQPVLNEHLVFVFNTYSGFAHGFGWPNMVPSIVKAPTAFPSDLWTTASVSLMAIDQLQRAAGIPSIQRESQ